MKNYNNEIERYSIRKNTKFTSHIDVKLRILYYLKSLLVQIERTGTLPTFDEIIREILPLLKNGTTPEKQTILTVLEEIAERVGTD